MSKGLAMAKLTDGLEINPFRPSVVENVEHTAHTQIGIPLGRARAVSWVRFGGLLADVLMVAAGVAALYYLVAGPQWAGFVLLAVLFILAALAWAFGPPMAEFVDAQMKDLRDPFRDSEWRAVQAMRVQQHAPAAPVVRIESLVRDAGSTQPRTILDDLPGPIDKLQWFCRNILESRSAFSERTARASDVGYTREQWATIRDVFLTHGWACSRS